LAPGIFNAYLLHDGLCMTSLVLCDVTCFDMPSHFKQITSKDKRGIWQQGIQQWRLSIYSLWYYHQSIPWSIFGSTVSYSYEQHRTMRFIQRLHSQNAPLNLSLDLLVAIILMQILLESFRFFSSKTVVESACPSSCKRKKIIQDELLPYCENYYCIVKTILLR